MFKFIKAGVEYGKLAKSFGIVHEELNHLNRMIDQPEMESIFKIEFCKTVFFYHLAVNKRIEKNSWPLYGKIHVHLNNRLVTLPLINIWTQCNSQIEEIATKSGLMDYINKIIENDDYSIVTETRILLDPKMKKLI